MGGKGNIKNSVIRLTVIGTLVTVAMGIVLAILMTALILKERVAEEQLVYLSMPILFVCAFCGCMVTRALDRDMRLIGSVGVCSTFVCVLICAGMLLFEGNFDGIVRSLVAVFVAGALACVLRLSKGKNRRSRKRTR